MTMTTFGDKRTQRQQKIQERMLRNRNLLGIPQENRLHHIL